MCQNGQASVIWSTGCCYTHMWHWGTIAITFPRNILDETVKALALSLLITVLTVTTCASESRAPCNISFWHLNGRPVFSVLAASGLGDCPRYYHVPGKDASVKCFDALGQVYLPCLRFIVVRNGPVSYFGIRSLFLFLAYFSKILHC